MLHRLLDGRRVIRPHARAGPGRDCRIGPEHPGLERRAVRRADAAAGVRRARCPGAAHGRLEVAAVFARGGAKARARVAARRAGRARRTRPHGSDHPSGQGQRADRPFPRAARRDDGDGRHALALPGQVDARRAVRRGGAEHTRRARRPAVRRAQRGRKIRQRQEQPALPPHRRPVHLSRAARRRMAGDHLSRWPAPARRRSGDRWRPVRGAGNAGDAGARGRGFPFRRQPDPPRQHGVASVAAGPAAAEPRGRATVPAQHHRK